MNYTITNSRGGTSYSYTWEVALESAREAIRDTNDVATISCNQGHFSESYKWDFEMDDLLPA